MITEFVCVLETTILEFAFSNSNLETLQGKVNHILSSQNPSLNCCVPFLTRMMQIPSMLLAIHTVTRGRKAS